MSGIIYRQAAVDTLRMDISIIPFAKAREYVREAIETIYNRLEELPSAQPEIIYCKECVCGHCEVWLCGDGSTDVYGYCGRTNLRVLPYDYCSWSERRENG